jgi:glycosyltransferase involved in cell wall biosynthesis
VKALVWHWGRHGAGPRFAAELAAGLAALPGVSSVLSLAAGAEILRIADPPRCDLTVTTYAGVPGLAWRLLTAPALRRRLDRELDILRPDIAVCAMPAALDRFMFSVLRRRRVPSVVIADDAVAHPGDRVPFRFVLDRHVLRRADAIATLSSHVAAQLQARPALRTRKFLALSHPPFNFGPMPAPRAHGGPLRVLSFGRLRAYKGLLLLADALSCVAPARDVRVVGHGPESPALAALRALPGVRVENRWVPEPEISELLAWADVIVLSHVAASQSGVAAAALGAGRFIVATEVGGIGAQLRDMPGVILCPPEPASLAAALNCVADAAIPRRVDAAAAWRAMAAALLEQVAKQGQGSALDPLRASP